MVGDGWQWSIVSGSDWLHENHKKRPRNRGSKAFLYFCLSAIRWQPCAYYGGSWGGQGTCPRAQLQGVIMSAIGKSERKVRKIGYFFMIDFQQS